MQQPQIQETWRPTRKLLATFLLAVLGLVAVVCLFDSGTIPHGPVTGALAMGARMSPVSMQPNQRSSAAAQPTGPAAKQQNAKPLPPLHTFRAETPPQDEPDVDCWLDPNSKWDTKPYECASRTELAARVNLEDSY